MTNKKALKLKMAATLKDELNELSAGMREIFIEDFVCAFENRLKVLVKEESLSECAVNFEEILA